MAKRAYTGIALETLRACYAPNSSFVAFCSFRGPFLHTTSRCAPEAQGSLARGARQAQVRSHTSAPKPAASNAAESICVPPSSRATIARTGRWRSDVAESESNPADAPDQTPAVEAASLPSSRKLMPPPLRGSYESLVRQNEKTEDKDGLERIEDDADLNDRIARKMLVPVPVSAALSVNQNLPENRRYCRPWTARFLSDLARAHAAAFHGPLEVSSAVRTVEYQEKLERVNGNAAAAEGDIASPHLTGATIDIAKNGMSRKEVAWMRAHLLPLQNAGKIDVEEEFKQSCFHITVYKSYLPSAPTQKPAAQAAAAASDPDGSGI